MCGGGDVNLSNRARRFLDNSKWKDSVREEKDIIQAFEAAGIAPTNALIEFQKNFGGFTYYAYLEPIVFGILHKPPCRGAFEHETGLIVIEPEDDIVVRHLECADTLYQETFTIDEQGRYYEGYDIQCHRFETHIENLAMLEQVNTGKWKSVFKYELDFYHKGCYDIVDQTKYGELVRRLGLKKIDDFPEDIVSWDTNGELLVWRKADAVNVLSETGISARQRKEIEEIFG